MKRGATGRFETTSAGGEHVRAFLPNALPPEPAIDLGGPLQRELEKALLSLGRLDTLSTVLPDTELFLYSYVRKEAVLSSQIEGTQSSLSDLLLFELDEAPGVPMDDVVEVSNYVAALNHGLGRIRGGFPLSNRLLREIHGVLLAGGRGGEKAPGELRRSQNWIGGSRPGNAHFVPPPPDAVPDCMTDLETFLHEGEIGLPVLIKAGLAHAQFETIHPFLDGNGRVGRLLITLLLCEAGVLRQPLLYLSLHLKENREEYYRKLDSVRTEGEWEEWLGFFLDGVHTTADQAVSAAQRIQALFAEDREKIQAGGRMASSALRVHHFMRERPLTAIQDACNETDLTFPTVSKAMSLLAELGVAREITGRKRDRVFAYDRYLEILNEGT